MSVGPKKCIMYLQARDMMMQMMCESQAMQSPPSHVLEGNHNDFSATLFIPTCQSHQFMVMAISTFKIFSLESLVLVHIDEYFSQLLISDVLLFTHRHRHTQLDGK